MAPAVANPSSAPVAFLNLPYSKRYEPVYLALIAGISAYGLVPTVAVRDPSSRYQLVANLLAVYRAVQKTGRRIKRNYSRDLFDARPFSELTFVASEAAP
jgi:hypothetical protein